MKTAKVTKFEITATNNGANWTVEVQLPAIVGYENEFRFRESAPTITEALEKLGAMLEGAEYYVANDGDIGFALREAESREAHRVDYSDTVTEILLIVPVDGSDHYYVAYFDNKPAGWMDDTGIRVFDEGALACLKERGAVIY